MISLYLDEDSKHSQLISAIRRRGWDVVGSGEAGMDGEADSRQLEYAVRLGRPLLTGNIRDFGRLHGEWLRDGRAHPGLIFWFRYDHSLSDLVRGVLAVMEGQTPDGMRDRVEWLSDWL